MAWIYIIIAALFEAAWTFSLKVLSFKDIKALPLNKYWQMEGILVLMPLLGYIVFGLANVYFFSVSLKTVPTATAMAVWTAATLIFIKIAEIFFFHEKLNWLEIFFIMLITVGIIGLKVIGDK